MPSVAPLRTLSQIAENIRNGRPLVEGDNDEHAGMKMVFGVWRKVDGDHAAEAAYHKGESARNAEAYRASMASAVEAAGKGDNAAAEKHVRVGVASYSRAVGHSRASRAHDQHAAGAADAPPLDHPASYEDAEKLHGRDAHAAISAKWKGKGIDKALEKAKPPRPHKTYDDAHKAFQDHLEKQGWTVTRGLKTPHAVSPDGEVKLWMKPQAIHYTSKSEHGPKGMNDAGNARSASFKDLRDMTPEETERHVNPKGLKGQSPIRPENVR